MNKSIKFRTFVTAMLITVPALGLVSAPSAQASTPAASTCRVIAPKPTAEGHGDGRVCDGNITGTIHDDKADGRCPYIRIFFTVGDPWESPWAGGKGKAVNFGGYHDGEYTGAEIRYISC
ncbi:hypothetical protein HET69_30020 [Streptomyces sp. CJ_13]|uniref:hypothetical protein n=1 Tax=Streptomyces TaxID=1883 RepID=UPI000F433151|nr:MULTISPECIES: hypothetical protein [unclassified Streptomyces]AYV32131.1 hypothetical protein EES41_35850 [Streptomyces sp. ADI95-16]MBT1188101.1 hypothetical protein [Streptomyces sp. CJ_13]